MRKRRTSQLVIGAVATVFVATLGLGTWNVLRPLPAVAISQQALSLAPTVAAALGWPANGEAAVEARGVTPVLTSGTQKVLPMASVAKIITALAVLQAKPLNLAEQGPILTLAQADVDIYNNYVTKDGSVVHVAAGEQLSEYQALQALLLPSANNIADSLAIWAFGSLAAYHTAATQYVQQLGLANTTIGSDASGLAPDSTSTPADLVRLGEAAIDHPVVAQIVAQTFASIPVEGTVYNVNRLLGQDGIVGIKTGNSDQVGGNLLFAARAEVAPGKTATIIGAVMGQADLNAALDASPPLIDSVKANLYLARPVRAGETIANYSATWGAHSTAVAKKDLTLVAWKGTAIQPRINLSTAKKTYIKNATVGSVTASTGTSSAKSDVVLAETIPQPSLWWRITRH